MAENKIKWPNGARCAVMYSFDFDGETIFNDGPEGKDWEWPRSLSYGRYGPNRGVWHILNLLNQYNIKATFFVPARTAIQYPEQVRAIDLDGHEVALHGFEHESILGALSSDEQVAHIRRCQDVFRKIIGKEAKGFRCPSGDYNETLAFNLWDEGLMYSSSLRGDDRPYRVDFGQGETDFIEISNKLNIDDYPQFVYQYFPELPDSQDRIAHYRTVLDNWCREFDGYYKEGLCYVIMCHPLISGTPGRVQMHEKLIKHMKEYDDVWFTTGSEIAKWWRENY